MTYSPLVLGVDGGNTKTIALVARLDGTIIGAGRAGISDIYGAASVEAAMAELRTAVEEALAMAGGGAEQLVAGSFSMAGADWPEDFSLLEAAIRERGWGRTITVVNDAIGALRAGSPDGTGVVVSCGTGVAIGARAGDGSVWHTSHWQEQFGGAHQLGHDTLRAVYRAELGLDPPTHLTGRVLDALGRSSVEEVLHLFTARMTMQALGTATRKARDAQRLARILLDEAAGGDPTALRIVHDAGNGLGEYALVAARRVGLGGTAFTLVFTGGVFRHPAPLLGDTIVARVRAEEPGMRPVASQFEPAIGALFLSFEAVGIPIDAPLHTCVRESLPPTALFAT